MAILTRVFQKIFGDSGPVGEFGQIGSDDPIGTGVNTKDPATIQSLTAYDNGLFDITNAVTEPPRAEDINSLYFLITRQMSYMFQRGIPEWNTSEEYTTGSYTQVAGQIYKSVNTPNTGNDPTTDDGTNWEAVVLGGIVDSQVSFNALFERVSADVYKIKDGITSVTIRPLAGGYDCHSDTVGGGFIQVGDSFAQIQTNQCTSFKMESGAYLDFDTTDGFVEANTDDCLLENVWVRGSTSSTSTPVRSFLLNANRVTFRGCKTSDRDVATVGSFTAFEGSATALHNTTSKYVDCQIFDMVQSSGATFYGFLNAKNITNTLMYAIDSAVSPTIYGMSACDNIHDFTFNDVDNTSSGDVICLQACNNVSGCIMSDCTTSTGRIMLSEGASTAYNIHNVEVKNCTDGGTSGTGELVNDTKNIGNVFIKDFTVNSNYDIFDVCHAVSNVYIEGFNCLAASGNTKGFDNCNGVYGVYFHDCNITGTTIDFIGLSFCDSVSGVFIDNVDTTDDFDGLNNCKGVAGVRIENSSGTNSFDGLASCSGVSGVSVANNTSSGVADGLDSCRGISGISCESVSGATSRMFVSCRGMAGLHFNHPTPVPMTSCQEAAAGYQAIGSNTSTGNNYCDTADTNVTNKNSFQNIFV